MSVDAILSRLEKVKRTGNGTWLACCPAHRDKTPSLSVRELDDSRILIHCFAGCGVDAILDAAGVTFDALFPEKPITDGRPLRRPFPAADVLEALAFETQVVTLIAGDMYAKRSVSEEDYARLLRAQERITEARRLALG